MTLRIRLAKLLMLQNVEKSAPLLIVSPLIVSFGIYDDV